MSFTKLTTGANSIPAKELSRGRGTIFGDRKASEQQDCNLAFENGSFIYLLPFGWVALTLKNFSMVERSLHDEGDFYFGVSNNNPCVYLNLSGMMKLQ